MRPFLFLAFLFIALVVFFFPRGNGSAQEIDKLSHLRQEWQMSLKKESQLERTSYRKHLIELQERFTKNNKQRELQILNEELGILQLDSPPFADIPHWNKPCPIPSIRFARSIHIRKMEEMIRRKNGSYRRSLKNLEKRYLDGGFLENASLVTQELNVLNQHQTAYAMTRENLADSPQHSEQKAASPSGI